MYHATADSIIPLLKKNEDFLYFRRENPLLLKQGIVNHVN